MATSFWVFRIMPAHDIASSIQYYEMKMCLKTRFLFLEGKPERFVC